MDPGHNLLLRFFNPFVPELKSQCNLKNHRFKLCDVIFFIQTLTQKNKGKEDTQQGHT
jgi:hypothetical protein